jgi:hypothetical protein
MSLLPNGRIGKVEFFESHLTPWTADPSGIGSTPAQIAEMATLTAAARAAFKAQQEAQSVARAATATFNDAVAAMTNNGMAIIERARAKARVDGIHVYAAAWIPSPSKGSPVPAPGKPSELSVTLTAIGTFLLEWKCDNPTNAVGTMYQIHRQVLPPTGDGTFVFLGTSGVKTFEDRTLPAGAPRITYQITAIRSTARGRAAQFPIEIGVTGKLPFNMASINPRRQFAA